MYSVKEIADILKVHELTINRYIKAGKIKAVKIGSVWRVEKTEVERIIKYGIA